MVTTTSEDDVLCSLPCRMMHRPLSMSGIDPILASTFQDRVGGHEPAFVEDADAIGELMDFDDTPGICSASPASLLGCLRPISHTT